MKRALIAAGLLLGFALLAAPARAPATSPHETAAARRWAFRNGT